MSDGESKPPPYPAPRWRVGRKLGRTLYDGETLIGLVDTHEIARAVVAAMNVALTVTQVEADGLTAAFREGEDAPRPTFNHSREDSPRAPCKECAALMDAPALRVAIEDMRSVCDDARPCDRCGGVFKVEVTMCKACMDIVAPPASPTATGVVPPTPRDVVGWLSGDGASQNLASPPTETGGARERAMTALGLGEHGTSTLNRPAVVAVVTRLIVAADAREAELRRALDAFKSGAVIRENGELQARLSAAEAALANMEAACRQVAQRREANAAHACAGWDCASCGPASDAETLRDAMDDARAALSTRGTT